MTDPNINELKYNLDCDTYNNKLIYILDCTHQLLTVNKEYHYAKKHTCCTSAVVDLNSSIYLLPMSSRCFAKAFGASSSLANNTKASPVARPSALLTKRTPSAPSSTVHGLIPAEKKSNWNRQLSKLESIFYFERYWILFMTYHLSRSAIVR